MLLIRAKSSQSRTATKPEILVVGRVPEGDPEGDRFHITERILREAAFEHLPDHPEGVFIGHLGEVYEVRQFLREEGRKNTGVLRTTGGDFKYTGYLWVSPPEGFVSVYLNAEGTGTLQYVLLREEVLQKLLEESGLEKDFHVQNGRVVFRGDMTAERGFRVAGHYNNLTWMVYYQSRPNAQAAWTEEWSGAHFPDEKTARRIGQNWVNHQGKVICASLKQMKMLFPDSPTIPKVEAFEEKERKSRKF